MPDEKEEISRREQVEKIGKILGVVGKTAGELSGPSSASIVVPPVQGRAPAQVTAPPPFSMGRTPGTAPSLEGLAPQQQPAPTPGGLQTGLEFGTKGGRNAAIVTGAISNISQFLRQRKQKKENEIRSQVSGAMRTYSNLAESGDREGAERFLGNLDPKVLSAIEKGIGLMQKSKPEEKVEPEGLGVQDALKERVQRLQQSLSPKPSSEAQARSAAFATLLQSLKSGKISPQQFLSQFGEAMGKTPEQHERTMQIASGMSVPASQWAAMGHEEKILSMRLGHAFEATTRRLDAAWKMTTARIKSSEKIAEMRANIDFARAQLYQSRSGILESIKAGEATLTLVKEARAMEKKLRELSVQAEKSELSDEMSDGLIEEAKKYGKLADQYETQLPGRIRRSKTGLEEEGEVVTPSRPKDEIDRLLEESMTEGAR